MDVVKTVKLKKKLEQFNVWCALTDVI